MRSIWPLIMIILHGCGQTEDKTSSEQSKKYVSSLNLDELFKYDSLTEENPTLKMVETYRSPAACKLNREMNSLNAKIVKEVENKFCDTSEIEINKKYSIKLNDSKSPFKYLFRKIGDEKYIATHCHANGKKTVSIIETADDGKGRVVLYYDADGHQGGDKTESQFKSVFEKFYQGSENIVSSHFHSLKRAEVSQELSYSEISFSSQGGSWISSLNTIVPNPVANDPNKRNFFQRSI